MHIYNVKTKGHYIGPSKADLTFQVLGADGQKLEKVKDQLDDKLSMKIEPASLENGNKG